ncbi:hypothetical protein FE391_04600 [Nonomuraea sp. KC401]|uniref:hypothetical protein n=1 Tax=unclassified Nonomuraea TaxID=2593643 RepID=UPI0010FE31B2|nr:MULTISPECIES: hypothetical protein [unclassified Nonomuraea]NBE92903.1 hypothetical protein [Nonomuraea sp. K271]TLF83360.1 hypothetical protein FE391_04600 [Nonomuraea sp. KC401]
MRFVRRKQEASAEPDGEVTRVAPAAAYDGDLYRLPEWARRRGEERALGRAHAEGGQFDTLTLQTGSVPRFHELEDERLEELARIDECTEREIQRARAELEAQKIRLAESQRAFGEARKALDDSRQRVTELEQPSRRPGDGRPSSIAVSGSRWPVVRRWLPAALLLLLLLVVEVPILYQVILSWGDSVAMTALLAAGAALIMLVAPHMYGRAFRSWQEHGSSSQGRWLLIGVATVWLGLIVAVAVLRRDALVRPLVVDGQEIGPTSEGVGQLPTMVLLLALLVATALIAADLGRRMHNPNDRRLRELRAKRDAEARVFAEAQAAYQHDAGYAESIVHYVEAAERRRASRLRQLDSGFDSLATAYLGGVVEGLKDPEAASWAERIVLQRRTRS